MSTLRRWIQEISGLAGRWLGPSRRSGWEQLRVYSSVRLGPQHAVYAIGLGSQSWVLVCDSKGTTVLSSASNAPRLSTAAQGGAK
jgi:hypothetical protein